MFCSSSCASICGQTKRNYNIGREGIGVREYIRQHVDASVWERIQQLEWQDDICEENAGSVEIDPMEDAEEDEESSATVAIQALVVHSVITGPTETKTTATASQSHDWKDGARIGEAQNPGPVPRRPSRYGKGG